MVPDNNGVFWGFLSLSRGRGKFKEIKKTSAIMTSFFCIPGIDSSQNQEKTPKLGSHPSSGAVGVEFFITANFLILH